MTKKDESAVEPVSKNVGIADARPDYIKTDIAPRGTDAIGTGDMIMPRLVICQSGTEQRKKSNPNFIEGLEEGELFNSLTGEVYGQTVKFVPLFFYKSRILFRDLDQGGGMLCQSHDAQSCPMNHGGSCAHNTWGPNGEPPECTEFFNFPALLLPRKELIVLSFKSTGIKAAKQLNSFIRFRQADAFAGVYALTTAPDKNAAGQEYYVPVVANAGWAQKELYQFAEASYEALAPKIAANEVTMDVAGLSGEATQEAAPF